jgi:hypothetical protein
VFDVLGDKTLSYQSGFALDALTIGVNLYASLLAVKQSTLITDVL